MQLQLWVLTSNDCLNLLRWYFWSTVGIFCDILCFHTDRCDKWVATLALDVLDCLCWIFKFKLKLNSQLVFAYVWFLRVHCIIVCLSDCHEGQVSAFYRDLVVGLHRDRGYSVAALNLQRWFAITVSLLLYHLMNICAHGITGRTRCKA